MRDSDYDRINAEDPIDKDSFYAPAAGEMDLLKCQFGHHDGTHDDGCVVTTMDAPEFVAPVEADKKANAMTWKDGMFSSKRRPSILEEAGKLVDGDRQNTYGHPKDNYRKLAQVWSVVLDRKTTPEEVILCHLLIKIVREAYAPKRDNLVDIAGYARVMEMLGE